MRSTIQITSALLLLFECILEYELAEGKCFKRSNLTTPKGSRLDTKSAQSHTKPTAEKDGKQKERKDTWNEKTGAKAPEPCPKYEYRPCPWNYDHICWCDHNCDNSWTLCKDAGPYSDKGGVTKYGKPPDPCPKQEYRPCPWEYDHVCWCNHNCDNSWTVCKDAGSWY